MEKLDVFKMELVRLIHEDLTGDIEIGLNKYHFELLEKKTGLSNRKLKELFGIYKRRSLKCHEYTLNKLAEFAGFKDWNHFIKSRSILKRENNLAQKRQTELSRKISINKKSQKKVKISILVS